MERLKSTFEKAVAAKESRGEIVYLSRNMTVMIDSRVSDSLSKRTPKK